MSAHQNYHINFNYHGINYNIDLIAEQKADCMININGVAYAILGDTENLNTAQIILNSVSLDALQSQDDLMDRLSAITDISFPEKTAIIDISAPSLSPNKIPAGPKTTLNDEKVSTGLSKDEEIKSEVKTVMNQLDDGWVKERLTKWFFSDNSHKDAFIKEKLQSKFGFSEAKADAFFLERKNKGIKKDSSHFQMATESCYDSFNVTGKKVVVTGEVSTDGWGDYFQMWLTANNLAKTMPEISVLISARLSNHQLPPEAPKAPQNVENLIFIDSDDSKKREVENKLKEADLLINIPHGYVSNPWKKPVLRVEEYGFNPGTEYALGLSVASSKIVGIPLTTVSSAESIHELSHTSLRDHLLEKNRPFYVGYLKEEQASNERHRAGFVLAAAAIQNTFSSDIDIVCPFKDINALDINSLQKLNIGRVVLLERERDGTLKEIQDITVAPTGREIRILNPFPLSNEDWMVLLKFCEPLVGCTGDMSFSEVISNKKIPFYQIRWHKVEFMEQLIEFCGLDYGEDYIKFHQVLKLLNECLVENSKATDLPGNFLDIGRLVDEQLVSECQKFANRIEQHYCANVILASRVKRELAYAQYPELKKSEEEIFNKWKSGEIALQRARELLSSQIAHLQP